MLEFAEGTASPAGRVRSVVRRAGVVVAAATLGLMLGGAGPSSVAPIAERLIDAVVNISTTQTVKGPEGVPLPRVPKGSPFEEFFDDFFNKKGGRSQGDRKVSSLGSGFVLDAKEGLIVTNNHVIEGADEIIINFNDGSKLKVEKILGKDTKTDLALLKVTPKKPLVQAGFGSSSKLKVGDWVMAIGNPFGLGGTVTVGIISAKQRDINSGPYDDFLQTDAAINKGNSGGPLFNMDGDVIGVNTAIISPTGGSIGIGFAVPADTAVTVLDQLRQFGETRRGWLGVKVQSVNEDIADSLNDADGVGALVSSVTPGGPAAKGGVLDGDVILRFDGKDIASVRGLPRAVAQTQIGKEVDVEVLRKGEKKTLKVAVGRLMEDDDTIAKAGDRNGDSKPAGRSLLGLKLAPITDELRTKYKLDRKAKGLVVTEVDPASGAARQRIKPGDVVVEVANDAVQSLADVEKGIAKMRKAGKDQILLSVNDGKGDLRFINVPVQ